MPSRRTATGATPKATTSGTWQARAIIQAATADNPMALPRPSAPVATEPMKRVWSRSSRWTARRSARRSVADRNAFIARPLLRRPRR